MDDVLRLPNTLGTGRCAQLAVLSTSASGAQGTHGHKIHRPSVIDVRVSGKADLYSAACDRAGRRRYASVQAADDAGRQRPREPQRRADGEHRLAYPQPS